MSEDRKLPTRSKSTDTVQLHDNGLKSGTLIDKSLSRLNDGQIQNLMAKAGEEALRLEVKNREQNMDYILGKKIAEDHIDTFNMLEKSGKTTRQKVVSEIKTGAGNMRIESKSGATCFIASIAYDNPNHPDVMFLRIYRDTTLSKTNYGKRFISLYWKVGPKAAKFIDKSKILKIASRYVISKIVRALGGPATR